jgi:acetyl esterase/lipase
MKQFQILIIVFVFCCSNCNSRENENRLNDGSIPEEISTWTDINYAGDDFVYHRMDIQLPETGKESYPAIIAIYGSAFFGNNAKQQAFKTLGQPLIDKEFAVITVNHRSSRDALFPAQIQDIKASVRFIRGNGHKYRIDTSFIGITGYSSGGHLAAMTGTTGSVKLLTVNSESADIEGNVGEYTSLSSSVDAVVDWFGPTDFQVMDSCGSEMVHDAPDSPESSLIGAPIQENDDKCVLADPTTYVSMDDPPFLIIHGDNDPLVPHCQSEILFKALQDMNVPSEFVLVPGAKHGPGLFEDKYFKMMTGFFLDISQNK